MTLASSSERQITKIVSSPAIVPATSSRRTGVDGGGQEVGCSDLGAQDQLIADFDGGDKQELAPASEADVGSFTVVGGSPVMVGHRVDERAGGVAHLGGPQVHEVA